MMCSCDREFGEKHLPHQLRQGCVLETQERVDVTHGFFDNVCPECRGERPVAAPKAPIHRRTSKIKRYYWREIHFGTVCRLEEAGHAQPSSLMGSALWESAEAAVIEDLKRLHERDPKYEYTDSPPSEIIAENQVRVVEVSVPHVRGSGRKVLVESEGEHLTAEQFAVQYYKQDGFSALECESVPFHVLFGVYTWSLIQDTKDPLLRVASFGERDSALRDETPIMIETVLPSDFGTPGYYSRREDEINRHLGQLKCMADFFDEWLDDSWELRQYLWAHNQRDIDKARQLVILLGDERLRAVLRYLLMNYWQNYCGWPDLFLYQGESRRFVEVKSSKDKLSQDQMNWIRGNAAHMEFEFEVLKLIRQSA